MQTHLEKGYGRLPLSFEVNQGQVDRRVQFLSQGPGYTLFLTRTGDAVLALRRPGSEGDPLRHVSSAKEAVGTHKVGSATALRMKLVGANTAPRVVGTEELPGKANYFIGNDPRKWRANVPTYARAKYEAVYPGVDLVYYGNQRQLEYDFVVAPGADPGSIAIAFEGAERVSRDAHGNLVVATKTGDVQFQKPVFYQVADGVRTEVSGSYAAPGRSGQVGFRLAAYDRERPLIIDPVLSYSTYLGSGSQLFGLNLDESGEAIAVDSTGAAYVTGRTFSSGFPTTVGAFDRTKGQDYADAFVTKLNPTGTALVYSTFLGGNLFDGGLDIAVDSAGSAFVTGQTCSADFPTTPGAFQTNYASGSQCNDAFVTKLDAAGAALSYSTFLGGNSLDLGGGIAVDSGGSAYVTGYTLSGNFPTTSGAFQTTKPGAYDVFVTKLNPAGSALLYSTYLGGTFSEFGQGIAVDSAGSAYVTGNTNSTNFPTTVGAFQTIFGGEEDAFVTKLDPSGSALAYSTYLGGSRFEPPAGIAVDGEGAAYVAGYTFSTNFPTTAGAFQTVKAGEYDAYVTKLDPAGSALVYSTLLGGSGFEQANDIAVDSYGSAYVTGRTCSTDFPTTAGTLQTSNASGGCEDVIVTKLNPTGSAPLVFSTYLGGSFSDGGLGIAVDSRGSAYVAGSTNSGQNPNNFPTTPGAFQTTRPGDEDAFVAKISDIGTPTTLTLLPAAAANTVGTQHCVDAIVYDEFGNLKPSVTVRFSITGSVNTGGAAETDANGNTTFCYTGPDLPGTDAITAYADTDEDGVRDSGEPDGAAEKTWLPPSTTPLCEIKITNASIVAVNGDKAAFTGSARSLADGSTQGQEEYQDLGPLQRMKVRSINVLAIVCEGSTEASIYGQATIDGAGSFSYRIKVKDLSKPGKGGDMYWIVLANGYNSGEQPLQGGNVQINRD